jgi:hypothetical protein
MGCTCIAHWGNSKVYNISIQNSEKNKINWKTCAYMRLKIVGSRYLQMKGSCKHGDGLGVS